MERKAEDAPRKGSVGYSPSLLQMGRGEGIQPFVPQPQAQGTPAASSSREPEGSAARRPGVSAGAEHRSVHSWFPHAPRGSITASSWPGALRGLGLVILRHPQAFWTILNDTVNKLLWVYISNITLLSKLELSVSNSITCLQTSVKLGDIRGAKGRSLFHGNRWTGVPSSP